MIYVKSFFLIETQNLATLLVLGVELWTDNGN